MAPTSTISGWWPEVQEPLEAGSQIQLGQLALKLTLEPAETSSTTAFPAARPAPAAIATTAAAALVLALALWPGLSARALALPGDFKPGNILRVGEAWKLGDLGMARPASDGHWTQWGGTEDYRSPESL
ncbi:hypothetical protein WCLP8_4870010 [uncultured Gammaproteobacteria bacterium]